VFADSFKVEARELAVQHRQFSLPEFDSSSRELIELC